jgi:hypothetical protein
MKNLAPKVTNDTIVKQGLFFCGGGMEKGWVKGQNEVGSE